MEKISEVSHLIEYTRVPVEQRVDQITNLHDGFVLILFERTKLVLYNPLTYRPLKTIILPFILSSPSFHQQLNIHENSSSLFACLLFD